MAESFTYGQDVVGSSDTEIYTCPSSGVTEALIIGGSIANVDTVQRTVTIKRLCFAASVTRTIGKNIPIPPGASLGIKDVFGTLVLKPGDQLLVSCSSNNQAEAFFDVLERS
jgi:hypothetical protein